MARLRRCTAVVTTFASAISVAACDDAARGVACTLDRDCPSGTCAADGTCGAAPDGGDPQQPTADGALAACTPDHDGEIQADEVVVVLGVEATFRAATDVPFDPAGTPLDGGGRRWDLSGELEGDHDVVVTASAPGDRWFVPDYDGAGFLTPLDLGRFGALAGDLYGVYRRDADRVVLLGAASDDDGARRTELVYDPPAPLMVFPLRAGDGWHGEHAVSGPAAGVPTVFRDSFEALVDAEGEVVTPYGAFPVVRLRVDLTRLVGLLPTTQRSYLFVAECFGAVATVTSKPNDPDAALGTYGEIRRLAR